LTYDQLQRAAQQGWEAVVDRNLANTDAQKMYAAGAKKIGTDESAFLQVMALRHYYQLRATFQEYQKVNHQLFPHKNRFSKQIKIKNEQKLKSQSFF